MSEHTLSVSATRLRRLRQALAGSWSDGFAVRAAWVIFVALIIVIGGTLFGSPFVAKASMVLLAGLVVKWAKDRLVEATCALFVYLAMEGMYKYLTGYSPLVYVIRPALIAAIFICWLTCFLPRRPPAADPPMKTAVVTFLAWGALCIFHPYGGGFLSSVATYALFYATPAAMYLAGYSYVVYRRHVLLFLFTLLAACTVVSLVTALQFQKGQEWTFAHLPGYDVMPLDQAGWFTMDEDGAVTATGFRPASTTASGGGGATWSSLGMIVATGLLHLARTWRRRTVLALALLINAMGLLLSGVRLYSFVAGFGLITLLFAMARSPKEVFRSLRMTVVCLLLFGGGYWGASQISSGTIQARYSKTFADPVGRFKTERGGNFMAFLSLSVNYPLGAGYIGGLGYKSATATAIGGATDGAGAAAQARNGETQFGAIAGDMGIPGVLLLGGIYLGSLWLGWRVCRQMRDSTLRVLAATLLGTIAAYLPAWFGGPTLQGTVHFWFATAMLLALPKIERLERSQLALLASYAPQEPDFHAKTI